MQQFHCGGNGSAADRVTVAVEPMPFDTGRRAWNADGDVDQTDGFKTVGIGAGDAGRRHRCHRGAVQRGAGQAGGAIGHLASHVWIDCAVAFKDVGIDSQQLGLLSLVIGDGRTQKYGRRSGN